MRVSIPPSAAANNSGKQRKMHIVRIKVVLMTARRSLSASNCASHRHSSAAKSAHQMHRTSASMHICRFNHLKAGVMQVGQVNARLNQRNNDWWQVRSAQHSSQSTRTCRVNALSSSRPTRAVGLVVNLPASIYTHNDNDVRSLTEPSIFTDWRPKRNLKFVH